MTARICINTHSPVFNLSLALRPSFTSKNEEQDFKLWGFFSDIKKSVDWCVHKTETREQD